MIISLTVNYPTEQGMEMAKRYVKVAKENPPPDYVKEIGNFASVDLEKGSVVMSFYELPDDKATEGIQFITRSMLNYLGVPGMKWELKLWAKLADALTAMGMKDPRA